MQSEMAAWISPRSRQSAPPSGIKSSRSGRQMQRENTICERSALDCPVVAKTGAKTIIKWPSVPAGLRWFGGRIHTTGLLNRRLILSLFAKGPFYSTSHHKTECKHLLSKIIDSINLFARVSFSQNYNPVTFKNAIKGRIRDNLNLSVKGVK